MDTIFEDSSDDYGCHPSQTMKNYIDLNMEVSLFPKTPSKFLPEGLIEEIFSLDLLGAESTQNAQERVLWILEIQTKGDRELALADFIVGKARRIFLICIYCGLSAKELIHAMSIFMDHPFDDNNLPIPSADFERLVKVDKDPFGTMERDLPASGIVKGRHRLSRPSRILFIKNQHHFLAPVFSTTTLIHDLGERILPFIGDPGRIGLTREGLFGSVSEFTVHPSHFRDNQQQRSNPSYVIAVKEFKEGSYNSAQWENEARALEKMNTIHHDHIVRFMTAFRHNNMTAFRRDEGPNLGHFFCFEWADSGKVADMWNKDPQPLLSASLIRAVIQQLCGLAQALEATHYFKESDGKSPKESFIHGDLKPRNILWFRDDGGIGTLKLADWGEAEVDDGANTTTRHNTGGRYGTRRYEPPEIETGIAIDSCGSVKRVRSRLYDIWSFGCFSLEFTIRLLHGTKGLQKFRHNNIGGSFQELGPSFTSMCAKQSKTSSNTSYKET